MFIVHNIHCIAEQLTKKGSKNDGIFGKIFTTEGGLEQTDIFVANFNCRSVMTLCSTAFKHWLVTL